MKYIKEYRTGIVSAFALMLLILDTKTALSGASEGVQLCIYTVIPSLFPFFVLSMIIGSVFTGKRIPFLRPIGKLCGIPDGAESLLVLSILGGYPVGAQAVTQAWQNGSISRQTAHRLLGFCSNAGPAFIFGILGTMFPDIQAAWLLWGIHIVSAIIVGVLLPNKHDEVCSLKESAPITVVQALNASLRVMASVCGWIVLFRVVLAVAGRWFLWLFPTAVQVLLTGILELSNGCLALSNISQEGLRFLLAVCMISFGGLCIGMQTVSVTGKLGSGLYFPGKIMQSLISLLLGGLAQFLIFSGEQIYRIMPIIYAVMLGLGCLLLLWLYRRKKVVALSC